MKFIQLTQNMQAIVDDEDFGWLNQWKWYYDDRCAMTMKEKNKKRKTIFMHRLINKTPDGMETDHINRNKLDNRKINLRTVNRSENSINKPLSSNNTSGFKGITQIKNKWYTKIKLHGKVHYLGTYADLKTAILARKLGERLYYGKSE